MLTARTAFWRVLGLVLAVLGAAVASITAFVWHYTANSAEWSSSAPVPSRAAYTLLFIGLCLPQLCALLVNLVNALRKEIGRAWKDKPWVANFLLAFESESRPVRPDEADYADPLGSEEHSDLLPLQGTATWETFFSIVAVQSVEALIEMFGLVYFILAVHSLDQPLVALLFLPSMALFPLAVCAVFSVTRLKYSPLLVMGTASVWLAFLGLLAMNGRHQALLLPPLIGIRWWASFAPNLDDNVAFELLAAREQASREMSVTREYSFTRTSRTRTPGPRDRPRPRGFAFGHGSGPYGAEEPTSPLFGPVIMQWSRVGRISQLIATYKRHVEERSPHTHATWKALLCIISLFLWCYLRDGFSFAQLRNGTSELVDQPFGPSLQNMFFVAVLIGPAIADFLFSALVTTHQQWPVFALAFVATLAATLTLLLNATAGENCLSILIPSGPSALRPIQVSANGWFWFGLGLALLQLCVAIAVVLGAGRRIGGRAPPNVQALASALFARKQLTASGDGYESASDNSDSISPRDLPVGGMLPSPPSGLSAVQRDAEAGAREVIFICSTLYREAEEEVTKLLTSHMLLALWHANGNLPGVAIEFHLVFDGVTLEVMTGKDWRGQLVKEHKVGVRLYVTGLTWQYHNDRWIVRSFFLFVRDLDNAVRKLCRQPASLACGLSDRRVRTSYGWRSTELDFGAPGVNLVVHYKNPLKARRRKRWSQVLYTLLISKRLRQAATAKATGTLADDPFSVAVATVDPRHVFVLMTDGDVIYGPESVRSMLDVMRREANMAGVCARLKPQGSGPVAAYQKFEYDLGHWLQKTAESVLGSVMCASSCFSLFRFVALESVLEDFAATPTTASEYQMYEQGEDRWMCTLLIARGWSLGYCGTAVAKTFCPNTVSDLFVQRRRWVMSSLANIYRFAMESSRITRRSESVNGAFILYVWTVLASGLIAPAVTCLAFLWGLKSALHLESLFWPIALGIVLPLLFGAFCMWLATPGTVFLPRNKLQRQRALDRAMEIGNADYQAWRETIQLRVAYFLVGFYAVALLGSLIGLALEVRQNTTTAQSIAFFFVFGTVLVTALVQGELSSLPFGVIYLLGMPGAQIVLAIFVVCNADVMSWGTREGSSSGGAPFVSPITRCFRAIPRVIRSCIRLFCDCCYHRHFRHDDYEDEDEEAGRESKRLVSAKGPTSEAMQDQGTGPDKATARSEREKVEEEARQARMARRRAQRPALSQPAEISLPRPVLDPSTRDGALPVESKEAAESATLARDVTPPAPPSSNGSSGSTAPYTPLPQALASAISLHVAQDASPAESEPSGYPRYQHRHQHHQMQQNHRGYVRADPDNDYDDPDNPATDVAWWQHWHPIGKHMIEGDSEQVRVACWLCPQDLLSPHGAEQIPEDVFDFRNSVVWLYLLTNASWIVTTLVLSHQAPLMVAGSNAIDLVAISVFALLLVVQFLCMLWDRYTQIKRQLLRLSFEERCKVDARATKKQAVAVGQPEQAKQRAAKDEEAPASE